MQISLTVNDKQVKQSLRVLGVAGPNIVNRNITNSLNKAAQKIREYPPKPRESKYRRTGTFKRSVKVVEAKRKSGGGSWSRTAKLVTDARQKGRRYSVYVTGDARGRNQAYMHQAGYKGRKGFNVAADEVTKAAKPLIKRVERALQEELNRAAKG
jgi:hypothetical protein